MEHVAHARASAAHAAAAVCSGGVHSTSTYRIGARHVIHHILDIP